jgi:F-type H+-transporting ATPase subunit gamma
VKKVSLVLITGDRGLCGSYNSAVIKQATRRINKLNEQGIAVSIYCCSPSLKYLLL